MITAYVDQVGMSRPGADDRHIFHQCKFHGETYEECLQELEKNLGIKPPKRPRGVYIDSTSKGTVQVGFVVSRWNRDWSHPGKSWWEENWVTFANVEKTLPSLPNFLKEKS